MKKLILWLLLTMFVAAFSIAYADTVQIGTGTSTTSYLPLNGLYGYSYTQQIYTQTQIGVSGNIEKIRFYYVSGTITNSKDWVIYMGHTTKTTFSSSTDWEPLANLTQVFSGDVSSLVPQANNWMEITLDTPFSYNNTDNLVIAVDENTSGYASMSWGAFSSGSNTGIYYRNDSTNPDPASPPTANSRTSSINRIQLVFPSTSAPLAPTLVSPSDEATGVALNALLTWSATAGGGDATSYDVYMDTVDGSTLVSENQVEASYSVTLAYGTTYYWKVVASNAIGDSPASDVWSFTAMADPTVTVFPYTEGFESGNTHGSTSVSNWTQAYVTGTKYWTINSTNTDYNRTPRTGSFNATLAWSASTWMFRPVQLIGGTSYDFEVWARQDNANSTYASMTLAYGDQATPAAMVNTIVTQAPLTNGDYQRLLGSFTPPTSGIYYLGILGTLPTSTNWYVSLDDITIRETPSVPIISVVPESWDFGTQLINTINPKEFTISNIGAGSLNVSSINVTGTGFALAEAFSPVSLLPTESTTVTVSFSPIAEGPYTGTMVINDNRAVSNIPLSGSALDATIYADDLPHLENFDGVTTPALPLGWSTRVTDTSTYGYVRTVASGYSTPNRVSFYNSSDSASDLILISPPVDVALNNLRVKFMVYGGSNYTLQVGTANTSGQDATFTPYQTVNPAAAWNQFSVDFSAYAGTDQYIAFRHGQGGTYRTIYIDDVTIEVPAPIAPEPATVVFPFDDMTTLVNPILSWTPSATGEPALSYKVYLNDTGTFSEDDLVYEGTALQYQTTGLVVDRTYFWKVLPTNNYGSDPTCPTWSFNTPGPDQLAEGFEDTTFPPAGWANGTSGNWTRSTTTPVYQGSATAYKYGSSSTAYILSLPMLTISGGDYLRFASRASTLTGTLDVVYSEDRSSWTLLQTITHGVASAWQSNEVDLSSIEGNYYLGIRTGLQSASFYIDHIIGPNITPLVPGAPTLTAPADAAVNQSRYPSLSWSAPSTGGVPTGYNVYLDTVDGSTLFASNVTSPYTVTTALDWEQTYYWTVKAFNAAGTGDAPAARSFTVMADPTIYELPYSVDFGTVSGDWPVAGWTQLSGFYPTPDGTSAQWVQDDWLNVATPANKAAKINIYGTTRYGWLVTPPIAIPSDGYELKFDVALLDWNGTVPPVAGEQADDKFIVVMSDTPTMSNPVILREWNNDDSPYVFDAISHTGSPVTIPLTGVTGTKYFAFYGESSASGGDNDLMVDNVLIRLIPTGSPDPVTLTSPADGAENLSINGFNLTWTPAITGGNPTEYFVLMGTTNDPDNMEYLWEPGDVTTFNPTLAEIDPITFNYSETWYWTVIATNGDGDSEVPTPFSFTIMPDPRVLSLPYSQNFDGVPSSSMPEAWTGYVNSTSSYAYVRTTTSYPVSAPNSMYLTNSSDTSADLRLITPEILVPMNTIKLSFSARGGSSGYTLLVGTVDATDETGTFNQLASFDLTSTHTVYTLSLADYVGTDQYICFKHGGGGTYRSIYIDNVYMEELVDTDMSVVSLTGMSYGFQNTPIAHTVTVKNNGTEPVSNYTVYLKSVTTRAILGQESFTDPLAADATNAVEFTWTPTMLGSTQIYGEVFVAGDAVAENNVSEAMTFDVLQEGILFEDFEGGVIPANWTVLNADGGAQVWQATTVNPRTGTYAARVRYETSSLDNDDWLITPPLQVTSGTTDNISFWMRSYSATDADPWQVLISTTDTNPASFTMIDEGDGMLANYVQKSYNLDSYGDAVIYLAVRYMGAYDWYLYVDDFVGPPIFTPTALATPDVTISTVGNNVVLNWAAIPYATSYEVMAADAPEGPYTLAATVTAPTYSSAAASKKFYKVIAKAGATRSIVSPVLSLEQQLLQDEMDRAARSRQ